MHSSLSKNQNKWTTTARFREPVRSAAFHLIDASYDVYGQDMARRLEKSPLKYAGLRSKGVRSNLISSACDKEYNVDVGDRASLVERVKKVSKKKYRFVQPSIRVYTRSEVLGGPRTAAKTDVYTHQEYNINTGSKKELYQNVKDSPVRKNKKW